MSVSKSEESILLIQANRNDERVGSCLLEVIGFEVLASLSDSARGIFMSKFLRMFSFGFLVVMVSL